MTHLTPPIDGAFSPFEEEMTDYDLPEKFTFPFDYQPHPLSLLAVEKLQHHLVSQQDWAHNFGLGDSQERAIGKMFGVLVVKTPENEVGYLSAFSGKLAGSNHHAKFVPPIFDGMEAGGFLNTGMTELTKINLEIKRLEEARSKLHEAHISVLKTVRKNNSNALQKEIFNQYHFLNQAGEEKSLCGIFEEAAYKNPPAGAGECAAPKLLQYAFQQNMKPLAMAEFWWGLSPKSDYWKHGQFYPACQEKCAPILSHMLEGIALEEPAGDTVNLV